MAQKRPALNVIYAIASGGKTPVFDFVFVCFCIGLLYRIGLADKKIISLQLSKHIPDVTL